MLSTYNETIQNRKWYDYDIIGSTNDELKKYINDADKIVITAKKQTNGRGRLGRSWVSNEGNLYFSYGLEISPQTLSQVVCIVGLSLAKTIKQIAPLVNIKIKWPNDLMIEDKKISGIIFENIKDNLWCIGIGVNIQSSPSLKETTLYKATSLKEHGIILDRIEFLRYYLANFDEDYEQYRINGFGAIRQQWLELAKNLNQTINVSINNNVKVGTLKTIDENGYLILAYKDKEEKIIVGDIFI